MKSKVLQEARNNNTYLPSVFGYGNFGDGEKSFNMSTVVNLTMSSGLAFGLFLSSSDFSLSGLGTAVVEPNSFMTS